MYCLHCRIPVHNPLTLGNLYVNVALLVNNKSKTKVGDKVNVWNADRSGQVEAEVYNITASRRLASDLRWKIAE